ncbi:hypothetical protein NE237_008017 [Protea cynaroides]|uniref:Uncharacterized protein n=1 Tax=Protea cynaroides TaxID=273540 RepID=A0A9Q0KQ98_9MAGN|nr:hypothetical protein NE237_008017 [Protea cynaroides]
MPTGASCLSAARLSSDSRRLQIVSMIARGIGQKGSVLHLQIPLITLAGGVEDRCTESRDLSIVVGHRNDKEVAKVLINKISMVGEPTVVSEGDDTTAMGVYGWLGPTGQLIASSSSDLFLSNRGILLGGDLFKLLFLGCCRQLGRRDQRQGFITGRCRKSAGDRGIFVGDSFCGCDNGYCRWSAKGSRI